MELKVGGAFGSPIVGGVIGRNGVVAPKFSAAQQGGDVRVLFKVEGGDSPEELPEAQRLALQREVLEACLHIMEQVGIVRGAMTAPGQVVKVVRQDGKYYYALMDQETASRLVVRVMDDSGALYTQREPTGSITVQEVPNCFGERGLALMKVRTLATSRSHNKNWSWLDLRRFTDDPWFLWCLIKAGAPCEKSWVNLVASQEALQRIAVDPWFQKSLSRDARLEVLRRIEDERFLRDRLFDYRDNTPEKGLCLARMDDLAFMENVGVFAAADSNRLTQSGVKHLMCIQGGREVINRFFLERWTDLKNRSLLYDHVSQESWCLAVERWDDCPDRAEEAIWRVENPDVLRANLSRVGDPWSLFAKICGRNGTADVVSHEVHVWLLARDFPFSGNNVEGFKNRSDARTHYQTLVRDAVRTYLGEMTS